MVIDSLQAFKALQASGFTEAQAQSVVATIQQIDTSGLATKSDVTDLRSEITALRAEARETALTLQLRLGGMIVALGGVLVAVKYFGN